MKHFDYPIDERDASRVMPLETRVMIHGKDGRYFGFTYRWNDEGTDAALLTSSDSREFEVTTMDGNARLVKWDFPSRGECMHCHTSAAGYVLGLRTHQLNSDFLYPSGKTDNQLETLNHLGLFSDDFDATELASFAASKAISDSSASVESRVRSYLDSNCSQCHQPGGVYAGFDARLTTPLGEQGIINGGLLRNYGIEGQAVVRPRDTSKSIMHLRLHSLGDEKMPPLAKNMVDSEAERVLSEWIHGINPELWPSNRLVSSANGPPAAVSEDAKIWQGGEIQIDILSNDFDREDNLDDSSVLIVSKPSQGELVFDKEAKAFSYKHTGSGSDTFTYRVSDREGLLSNVARVNVELRPISEFDFPEPEPEPIPEPVVVKPVVEEVVPTVEEPIEPVKTEKPPAPVESEKAAPSMIIPIVVVFLLLGMVILRRVIALKNAD